MPGKGRAGAYPAMTVKTPGTYSLELDQLGLSDLEESFTDHDDDLQLFTPDAAKTSQIFPGSSSQSIPDSSSQFFPGASSQSIPDPGDSSQSTPGASSQSIPGSSSQSIPGSSSQSITTPNDDQDVTTKRPSSYMTNSKKIQKKKEDIKHMKNVYDAAVKAFHAGKFKSLRKCATFYGVSTSKLHRMIVHSENFTGGTKKSKVFSYKEEKLIIDHVIRRQEIGCGVTWYQLQLLLQEVLQKLGNSNPDRVNIYEDQGYLPNMPFVRRFASRNNLALRMSLEISKGRQICSVSDLENWQADTQKYLLDNPRLADIFSNPSRMFNQDESAIESGSSKHKVLAPVGCKVIYHISGSSREHITTSYICSANGGLVSPRCIYKGKRNVAEVHLKNLSKDGLSGIWKFSVSDKGFMNQDLFLEVLKDLDAYLTAHNIPRPVLLIMDGASCHISLAAAEFFLLKDIQPWLLRPNFTHLLQPLDLSFFASLKKVLKKLAWDWQCDVTNAGQTLNKYSIVVLLQRATEICLAKPGLVQSGFRRSGFYPWDKSAPDRSKLKPAEIFADPVAAQVISEVTNESSLPDVTKEPSDMEVAVEPFDPEVDVEPTYLEVTAEPSNNPDVAVELSSSELTGETSLLEVAVEASYPVAAELTLAQSEVTPQEDTSILQVKDSILLEDIINFDPPVCSTFIQETSSQSIPDASFQSIPGPSSQSIAGVSSQSIPEASSQSIPVSSSQSIPPPWLGQTQICKVCSKRILNSIKEIHMKIHSDSSSGDKTNKEILSKESFKTIPDFSIEERKLQLTKFEVLLMTPAQKEEFDKIFEDKRCDEYKYEPLFSSWLHQKAATIPGEAEALKAVLESHIPANVKKRQNKRADKLPTGPERYDTSSKAWIEVLEEQNNKKRKTNNDDEEPKKKKSKKTAAKPKQKTTKKISKENSSTGKADNSKQKTKKKTPVNSSQSNQKTGGGRKKTIRT